jgi:hypothetical protein
VEEDGFVDMGKCAESIGILKEWLLLLLFGFYRWRLERGK